MTPAETQPRTPPVSSSLDVFLLGTVALDAAMELQDRLRTEIADRQDTHGAILVCEHPPCVTIGREGSFADVVVDRDELVSRRMDVHWVNRGGGTFVHLPGQLSVYVVVPLERLELGLYGFRSALEATLISVAEELKVPAERAIEPPGATCRCGQFAFIGCSVRDGVSAGGVHLNVSLSQEPLELVRWSHSGTRVTSLSAQRHRPLVMASVRESLVRHTAASLNYESFHLYTGHPLLHRSTRKVYVYI